MSVFLEVKNVTLDIPIFDVSRSFRSALIKYCVGGQIRQGENNKTISVRALENINFSLKSGDKLGLIGHNGSGKTSLLRLLAGVYSPLIGEVICKGRLTTLFNPSLGIDMEDTGLDNIYIIGMYLGMKKDDINRKKDDIIAFSGLGDYIKLPVRTYSSGMLLRLCFSIATALEPQVLLMDEGIGVGDAQFSKEAQARLEKFYDKIEVLVVASHSDDLIKKLCNKALLLKHGKIYAYGAVEEVLKKYHDSQYNETEHQSLELGTS